MRLSVLGAPRLWVEGEGLEPPSQQVLLLSAYLASYDVWVERGQIVGWLWPDDDEKAGRHNLSQLLYRHRNKPWLAGFESTPHKLRWQTESDVRLFRQAVADGRWGDALTHYGGAFLEDVLVDDVATVMDWLEQERNDLHSSWRDATLQYARQRHDAGEFTDAAKRLATALQYDALAEDVLQAYLENAAKAGQRDQALYAYERFERHLADELSMTPLANTRQLAEAIRDGTLAPPSAQTAHSATSSLPTSSLPTSSQTSLQTSSSQGSRPPASRGGLRGHSLPNDLTSFVGRDPERLDLAQMLADPDCRLLSILGSGGIGKSRLAIRVATEQSEHFADGSVFVALAPLTSATSLPMALIEALGLDPHPTHDPVDQLRDHLAATTMLLVLDNAEHLRSAVADLAATLLDAAPNLCVLITSREALGLRGEWRYELSGLAVPSDPTAKQVEAYDAVRLFVQSARRADPHFRLDADNRVAVATLCQRVEGVPLGIELAAAWMRMLSPHELTDELAHDLDLLESDAANIPERHRSLRAVFDYTWNLLSTREQQLLTRLSVFQGGFSKEAAQQVAGATLRTLLGLVNKSLLSRSDNGRFAMLDTVRHYAAEKLARDADIEHDTRAQHAHYYRSVAETATPKLSGSEQTAWLEHLATDHDNLRRALGWSLETHDIDTGLRLSAALWWFWQVRGHLREGRTWLEKVLAHPEAAAPTETRAKVLRGAGVVAWMQGELVDAQIFFAEALQILNKLGDEHGTARVLNNLGVVFYLKHDYARAEKTLHQGLDLFKKLGDESNIAGTLGNLGIVAHIRGDLDGARQTCEEVLEHFQALSDVWGIAISHNNLARVLCSQGHYAEALTHYRTGTELAHQNGAKRLLASLFEGLARTFTYAGDPLCAATLWGAADTLRTTLGAPREPVDDTDYEPSVRAARAATRDTLFRRAWDKGRRAALGDTVRFALTQSVSQTSS